MSSTFFPVGKFFTINISGVIDADVDEDSLLLYLRAKAIFFSFVSLFYFFPCLSFFFFFAISPAYMLFLQAGGNCSLISICVLLPLLFFYFAQRVRQKIGIPGHGIDRNIHRPRKVRC